MATETPAEKIELPSDKVDTEEFLLDTSDEKEAEEFREDILEEKVEEDEEEKKEEELEVEEEEPKEEDLELEVPVPIKAITKKYPEIFKDFPYLKKAYYREQEYTELLPTIDDAKQVIERAKSFDQFESDLMNGDSLSVLQAVKNSDKDAFGKIVDSYLPNLAKVDQQAYFHVLGNVFKQAVHNMVQESKRTENETLQQAAQILHQFMFGNSQWTEPTNFGPKVDNTEQQKLKDERAQFTQQKLDSAVNELTSRTENSLRSTVEQHIDPKGQMTDYVRRSAVREVMEKLEEAIVSDNRYVTIKDKLWEKAFEDNFSPNSLANIKKAHLSKAKTLLPQIILSVRGTALKGLGVRNSGSEKDKKGPLPVGRTASPQSTLKSSTDKPIPKGMRTLDYLMQD